MPLFSFARKFRVWRIFQLQGEKSPFIARRAGQHRFNTVPVRQ